MMERLGGWFKRKIQLILFLIGLIIAFTFNVDSIQIAGKLGKDKNAREQMVQMANNAAKSESVIAIAKERSGDSIVSDSLLRESYRQVKQASDDAGKILGLGWNLSGLVKPCVSNIPNKRLILCWNYAGMSPKFDSAISGPLGDSSKSYRLNVLLQDKMTETEGYRSDLKKNLNNSALQDTLSARINENDVAMYKFLAAMNTFNSSHFSAVSTIGYADKQHSVIRGIRHYSAGEKVWYIIRMPFQHPIMLLGFIITALAISLGSNFWFDLLKKLVSIRASGANPDESKKKTGE
jgi:hypothetical protein